MAIVETRSGRVEGARENDLHVFRGIPFAKPPTGPRRWHAPEREDRWDGVRPARFLGAACPQLPVAFDGLEFLSVPEEKSEDCLYLNVWTPGLDDARRPVMVWIHGGGFTIGSGGQTIYDGSTLANRGDVVVVTINYRLGVFGFLNLHEITSGRIPATGNEGLLDQIAALEWVQGSIAAFGGDPGNVTIFGESAGGLSVGSLLGMSAARGLFHQAIVQSGGANTANDLRHATRVAERVIAALGMESGDASPLLTVSTETLLRGQASVLVESETPGSTLPSMPLEPCIDGGVLTARPIELVRKGSAAGIPVMAGVTADEWRLFARTDPTLAALDERGLEERVVAMLGGAGRAMLDGYRSILGRTARPLDLYCAIASDRFFAVPTRRLLDVQRRHEPRTYGYRFGWHCPDPNRDLRACHALEIGFVFGTNGSSESLRRFCGEGREVEALARVMQDAWIRFAHDADPGFPPVGESGSTRIFDASGGVVPSPDAATHALWAMIPDAAVGNLRPGT